MNPAAIIASYRTASKRLFLLDYDGTLVNIAPTPPQAIPTPHLLRTLRALASDKRNTVAIVSGRDKLTLDTWLGSLPIAIAAEHGCFLKEAGQTMWSAHPRLGSDTWKQPIRAILQAYTTKLPHSFIEEKSSALAWHYRNAAAQQAATCLPDLITQLQKIAPLHGLMVLQGSKVVEIKPSGITKGTIATHWTTQNDWNFILAAGDDTTDEDLFKALPPQATSIKVGPGHTAATAHVKTPTNLLHLLTQLAEG